MKLIIDIGSNLMVASTQSRTGEQAVGLQKFDVPEQGTRLIVSKSFKYLVAISQEESVENVMSLFDQCLVSSKLSAIKCSSMVRSRFLGR